MLVVVGIESLLLPPKQVPVPEPGRYRVALDSDAWDFGGPGRVGHDVDHFTSVGALLAGRRRCWGQAVGGEGEEARGGC